MSRVIKEFRSNGVVSLWHLTHIDNVCSIINQGILNHYLAHDNNEDLVDISNHGVQQWREHRDPVYRKRIHEYTPLFISKRNPMLWSKSRLQSELCYIKVSIKVLDSTRFLFTDGNAAAQDTEFYKSSDEVRLLPWDVLGAQYWTDYFDGRRKKAAEVLIYPKIPPEFIEGIECYSQESVNLISDLGKDVYLKNKIF